MIRNWTWECLTEEAKRLKPEIDPETASYMGLDPKTGLAWFKVTGTRQAVVKSALEFTEDWVMVQLPGSHAIDEGPSALSA